MSSIEVGSNYIRVGIPKKVFEKLDWERKYKKGLNRVAWFDMRLGESTALVTSLYDESMLENVEKLRKFIGRGYI